MPLQSIAEGDLAELSADVVAGDGGAAQGDKIDESARSTVRLADPERKPRRLWFVLGWSMHAYRGSGCRSVGVESSVFDMRRASQSLLQRINLLLLLADLQLLLRNLLLLLRYGLAQRFDLVRH